MEYRFDERLRFSQSVVRTTCEETISEMIEGVISVTKSNLKDDLNGIDYWATLRRGATVGIDHKAREKGCSQYWTTGPELALETWSILPVGSYNGKVGWTLDESKQTDYTLHTFDPSDSNQCYMLPFQILRTIFRRNLNQWKTQYPTARQTSESWQSECIFVPASVVLGAVTKGMSKR